MAAASRIQQLDATVVNRIAAGEVVHRPASALKELIENSLDAGATAITITVDGGGLKFLQIQDNGSGIAKEDMGIVCRRFTTSKLRAFEDLASIATYGFRGEALASISHIAHVSIVSATPGAPCAFSGKYRDGAMVTAAGAPATAPTPCAGSPGTRITVEDMFHNVPTRLKALRSPGEEYRRILEVVQRYAVHAAARGVAFTCKKRRGNAADVRTAGAAGREGVIAALYGAGVAAELRPLAAATAPGSDAIFTASGLASHANWSAKALTLILFINHRLVASASLRRAVEAAYAPYLPKRRHPFVYLSLELPPASVDVNVHPTKREVHFLNEDAIVGALHDALAAQLAGGNASRAFATQSALPFSQAPPPTAPDAPPPSQSQPAPSRKVRVDGRASKLPTYFTATAPSQAPPASGSSSEAPAPAPTPATAAPAPAAHSAAGGCADCGAHGQGGAYTFVASYVDASVNNSDPGLAAAKAARSPGRRGVKRPAEAAVARRGRKRARPAFMKPVALDSVRRLLAEVAAEAHPELRTALAEHAFVGVVDAQRSVVQAGTQLLLLSHATLAREMFYQQVLRLFANTVPFTLTPPAPLADALAAAVADPTLTSGVPADAAARAARVAHGLELLAGKAAMLQEYFGIALGRPGGDAADSGPPTHLLALPRLVDGHTPVAAAVPRLLAALVWAVPWDAEEPCFRGVAHALAAAYAQLPPLFPATAPAAPPALPGSPGPPAADAAARDVGAGADAAREAARAHPGSGFAVVAEVLFPAMRGACAPSKAAAAAGAALQIACTQQLYRIFERC